MIKEISIQGKPHPVSFSMGALLYFCDQININVEQIDDVLANPTSYQTIWLAYSGFHYGALEKNLRFKMSLPEFERAAQEDPEMLNETLKFLGDRLVAKYGNADEKKRVTEKEEKG